MKKTFTINLNGVVFNIDDNAYNMLSEYLDNLHSAFAHQECGDEILSDIEERISEILSETIISAHRQVIQLDDVVQVITRIGSPEEVSSDVDYEMPTSQTQYPPEYNNDNSQRQPPKLETAEIKRRLYRDTKNGMIGGVCSGFAAYINADVTLIRIIAVAIAFFTLTSILIAYIILWIVVPEAKTATQRLQMSGEATTIENIGNEVKGAFIQTKNKIKEEAPSTFRRISNFIINIFAILAKCAMITIIIVSIPLLIALALALLACIFALIVVGIGHGAWFLNNIPGFDDYQNVLLALPATIGCIISIAIPLIALVYLFLCSFTKLKVLSKKWKYALLSIWIIGFIVAAIFCGLLINTQM